MKTPNLKQMLETDVSTAAAMEAARSLGRALGESPTFKRFETAYEVFQADRTARHKLNEFQSHQQEFRLAAMWGDATPERQNELEREWRSISAMPTLGGYLHAQEELATLFREVTGEISEEIGIDYGAACSPSGGCC